MERCSVQYSTLLGATCPPPELEVPATCENVLFFFGHVGFVLGRQERSNLPPLRKVLSISKFHTFLQKCLYSHSYWM